MAEQESRQSNRPFPTAPRSGGRPLHAGLKYLLIACGGVMMAILVFFFLKYLGY